MVQFIINISINFITFAICVIPFYLSEKTKGILEKIGASIFFAGILIVGTGIFISGGNTLQSYVYVILVVQIIILCIELISVLWSKSKVYNFIYPISNIFYSRFRSIHLLRCSEIYLDEV
ncbi:hypothetical protein [Listeria welshimeri]|uniref:hypothetical protein n=1 Tax=Listeria welshimeri TaxID=1643 RepID=UPI001E2B5E73|nr:hypothetical protein [Listeria welshimeri]